MTFFSDQCPWWLAGLLVAAISVGMQWAGKLHFGATGAFVAVQAWAAKPTEAPSWKVFFFVGIVGGGFLYALVTGGIHATFANETFDAIWGTSLGTKAIVLGTAGVAIGFGARMAGGCTSGHGICGISEASPASLTATATFVVTAVVVTNLLAVVVAGRS